MGQGPIDGLRPAETVVEPADITPTSDEIVKARRVLAEQIAALAERIGERINDFDEASKLTVELTAMEHLDWVYAQQISALQRRAETLRPLEVRVIKDPGA